jgi:hypothetical protein
MAINPQSRYYNSNVGYVRKSYDGEYTPIVFYSPDSLATVTYRDHVYKQGERLEGLSYKYFNRPDLWWSIVEYNPEIKDFFNITPGTILRIPNV